MSQSQDPSVSVIVPAWNGLPYIGACLDAVLRQGHAACELIVVDNASTDGTADLVERAYPQVRLVRNETNRGFAGGCNDGIRAARGEVLVLLNQDTEVQPGWLEALLRAVQEQQVGIVGCKILYPDGETVQHAGGWLEWPLGLAHHYGYREADDGRWDSSRSVECVTGAAMAFRREMLDRIGFLDEGFWPGYFEDADYCLRAREAGLEVWYASDATLWHQESTSLGEGDGLSKAYQRGRIRFLLKHLTPGRLLNEFVRAERDYQPQAVRGRESASLRLAYLDGILIAPSVLRDRWGADPETSTRVVDALLSLYEAAWAEGGQATEERVAVDTARLARESAHRVASTGARANRVPLPVFHEYEFRSDVPLLGPIIARVRSLWYGVAARWVLRQQEAFNRRQEAFRQQHEAFRQQQEAFSERQETIASALVQRIEVLAAENSRLAQELARLAIQNQQSEER